MTPYMFVSVAVNPAMAVLPAYLDNPNARAMILAICLQESSLFHRQQIGGPARGYAQFELPAVSRVLAHPVSSPIIARACASMDMTLDASYIYSAIGYNDALAVILARSLLRTLPQSLPNRDDMAGGWNQYIDAWRPGKPRIDDWAGNWESAWNVVIH